MASPQAPNRLSLRSATSTRIGLRHYSLPCLHALSYNWTQTTWLRGSFSTQLTHAPPETSLDGRPPFSLAVVAKEGASSILWYVS